MDMGFQKPYTTLVLVHMIISEIRTFLKQMNETNTHIIIKFVLENTHKYHANYSIIILNFKYEYGIMEISLIITRLKSPKGFTKTLTILFFRLVFLE